MVIPEFKQCKLRRYLQTYLRNKMGCKNVRLNLTIMTRECRKATKAFMKIRQSVCSRGTSDIKFTECSCKSPLPGKCTLHFFFFYSLGVDNTIHAISDMILSRLPASQTPICQRGELVLSLIVLAEKRRFVSVTSPK